MNSLLLAGTLLASGATALSATPEREPIKAFCVDFNWGPGGENGFAPPGLWADADPEVHAAWYAALGANTIQTFAVSCNGYAWYKGGIVPEQPGLRHDFLPELVRLGHEHNMRVMAYFCAGSNTRWSKENPDHSYGADSEPNIILSDHYLDFLAASIRDAVEKTGIDGFMVDWLWNPDGARQKLGGKWLPEERKLFEQVMGAPFPGEDQLTSAEKLEYSRRTIERAWNRIREAAKSVKPDCVIWLSCSNVQDPTVTGSVLFEEVDWLMNEHPDPTHIVTALGGGPRPAHQRILQCVVGWGDQHDALKAVTDPVAPTRDFYGFAKPGDSSLPLPIAEYLAKPVEEFTGNDRNIAVLARFYNGRLDMAARADRIAWFNEAKFGMFIHWGPFAVQGADPDAAFDFFDMKANPALRPRFVPYSEQFNPQRFDAAKWMDTAKAAGMRYIVFTTKHHDGYCLFDSALTDYDSVHHAPGHDFTRDVVQAARDSGLKVGFYYSILDWYHPDFVHDLPKYVDGFLFGQVRELCANYGPVDCLWFDGEWDHPAATWRADELVGLIRELQPAALINDRLGLGERGVTPLSDFYTREQPDEMKVAMPFEQQKPYPWEACMTIGNSWQYSMHDTQFKSVKELVWILVDTVSRGGNLLLNVGPTPDGEIPAPMVERLHGMGEWLKVNGEAIYGTTRSPFPAMPVGRCTAKANRLYLLLDGPPASPIELPGLRNEIRRAYLLASGTDLAFDNAAKTTASPDAVSEETITVVAVDLDGPPKVE